MSIGFGLLRSLVENDQPLSEVLERGLDESYFEQAERSAFNFIRNFKQKHGYYPNIQTIEVESGAKGAFSNLPTEPLDYWIPYVKDRKKFAIAKKTLSELRDSLDNEDTEAAFRQIQEAYGLLTKTQEGYTVKNLEDWEEEVLKSHDEVQLTPGITGIPFGFPSLDKITYGINPGDLVTLVGVTGACKSYICLRSALEAYLRGKNVLLISPEMPEKQIARRLLALQTHISEQDYRKGRLSYYATQKAREVIKQPIIVDDEEQDNFFKILPSGFYGDVQQIRTLCEEYKPDLLVADGFYLLNDSSSKGSAHWQEAENILKVLKQLAVEDDIGVLGSTQYNRSKPGQIQGARSTQGVEQLSSIFLSLEYESDEDKDMPKPQQTRLLRTKKTREGDSITVRLNLDFERMFIEEDEPISGSNLLDDDEDEASPSDVDFIEEI